MLKKTLLLAIAAMASLAFPAMASASGTWTHEGAALSSHTTIQHVGGTVKFSSKSGAGGIHCNKAHYTNTITNNGKSHILNFRCTGPLTFGALKSVFGCESEEVEATGPFNATPTSSSIEITEVSLVATMNAGCLVGEEIVIGDGEEPVTATPDNTEAMSSVTIGGEVETSIGPTDVEGEFPVSPAGTYGIE